MSDKISVIIPAYNAEKYISRTLKSVCNQTYKNLEIIIVDDGSTDNTFYICKTFKEQDNRISVYHKANEGVTKARDFGISKASGKYLAFVDSDDTIELDIYEILYNNIIKYDADISHCGHKLILQNNDIEYHFNTKKLVIQDNNKGIIDLIAGDSIEPGLWTKLYKKELFDNLDYDKSMKINEDYVINLLVFSRSQKSVFFDIPLYNYFMNDNSGSHQKTKHYYYLDILKAADFTIDLFEDNEMIFPYAQRRWFKTYSDMYKNHWLYDEKIMEFDRKSLLKSIINKIKKNYKQLKNNKLMNVSDVFILKMIKYSPKLLIVVCKIRSKLWKC